MCENNSGDGGDKLGVRPRKAAALGIPGSTKIVVATDFVFISQCLSEMPAASPAPSANRGAEQLKRPLSITLLTSHCLNTKRGVFGILFDPPSQPTLEFLPEKLPYLSWLSQSSKKRVLPVTSLADGVVTAQAAFVRFYSRAAHTMLSL